MSPDSLTGASLRRHRLGQGRPRRVHLGPDGEVAERFTIPHDSGGLKELVRRFLAAGVTEVEIERRDGPVVDALLQAGFTVLVIRPNQVKNLRSRYGSAGNKDDRFDAYVLADIVPAPTGEEVSGGLCKHFRGSEHR